MKHLVLTFLFLLGTYAFSQRSERIYLADTLEGWFRFEKNRHSLRFFAGINVLEQKNEDGLKVQSIYAPSLTLGYGYTPVNRLLLSLDFTYEYSFNKPYYDHQSYNYHFNAGYVLLGKQRFFLMPGIEFYIKNFVYRTHPNYPNMFFFGDSISEVRNSHYLFQLRPNINFGFNIFNNMTIQAGLGYNIILDRPLGRLPTAPITFNINFSYYFKKKK